MGRAARSNSSSANYRLGKYADARKYEQMANGTNLGFTSEKPFYMNARPAAGVKKRPKAYLAKRS